ncbi:peptidylprolyl isomerase [Gloeobacter morelensis MG652769]|uniref:Peptidyl-prolyl cis-trans isomerase n=2 Tax=Gloeobacter TaxID=33071 RepID=A0ABY3PJ47_9CYAN|nr:peptidylprolyl isomerase [Gloeobacter morelensis MG652769]
MAAGGVLFYYRCGGFGRVCMLRLCASALALLLVIPGLALAVDPPSGPLPAAASPDRLKTLPQLASKAYVKLETTKGAIVLELDGPNAPVSAGNFLDLVKRKFYDGLVFHRVVPDFVIQGGDPKGNGTGGFIDPATGRERTIPLEIKPTGAKEPVYGRIVEPTTPPVLPHAKGALAWARENNPNSASSQFYIALSDNPSIRALDGRYAVFGRVVSGMEVVANIRAGDKILKATEASVPPAGSVPKAP